MTENKPERIPPLAEALRLLRENRGLSRAKLSMLTASGPNRRPIAVGVLAHLERGRHNPSRAHLAALAKAYELDELDMLQFALSLVSVKRRAQGRVSTSTMGLSESGQLGATLGTEAEQAEREKTWKEVLP